MYNLKMNYKWRKYFICKKSKFVYKKENFDKWGSDDGLIHKSTLWQIVKLSLYQTKNWQYASSY